ncbi:hypothetical protein L2X99_12775 [Microbacterium sp. KUDC0406]|uniref:hypothetical protein n=1 Tax=Microbacterium sp. KUDC0406 TaxID=2909588 RepID=UPI001F39285A|nr:hypothetical protein [Microbacterium sp. KUDC0406]UJP09302.1 hypothetical protein L2X99_12775 [Microbacterium sp. KUDC0406]
MALTLASCTSGEKFSKASPAELPQIVSSEVPLPEANSVRLLGEDSEGVTYYVGRWNEDAADQYCLVIVNGDQYRRSCGDQLPVVGLFGNIHATVSDPLVVDQEKGTELVGDYLAVLRG